MMEFTKVVDEDIQALWVSDKQQPDPELTYWIGISIDALPDYSGGENPQEFLATVFAVIPDMTPQAVKDAARSSFDDFQTDLDELSEDQLEIFWIRVLQGWGSATLWEGKGTDEEKLTQLAQAQALWRGGFWFGAEMDRACNDYGADGWDFIRGNVYGVYAKKEA
jgi:hypothetical protein